MLGKVNHHWKKKYLNLPKNRKSLSNRKNLSSKMLEFLHVRKKNLAKLALRLKENKSVFIVKQILRLMRKLAPLVLNANALSSTRGMSMSLTMIQEGVLSLKIYSLRWIPNKWPNFQLILSLNQRLHQILLDFLLKSSQKF